MIVLNRTVIVTTLTQVPERFRFAPGYIVLSEIEARAASVGEATTLRRLRDIVRRHELARMREALDQAARSAR